MIHSQIQSRLCLALWFIISFAVVNTSAQDDVGDPVVFTRTVVLTVDVQSPVGGMLSDVPLQAYTKHGMVFGATDSNGRAILQLEASPDLDSIAVVRVFDGSWHTDLSEADRAHYLVRFNELLDTYAFSTRYAIDLDSNIDQYSYTLNAFEKVQMSGRFVNANSGDPLWAVFTSVFPYTHTFMTKEDGLFDVPVAKNAWAELLYGIPESHQLGIYSIASGDLQEDLEIGDIPIVAADVNAQLSIELLNPDVKIFDDLYLTNTKSSVTLISQDASIMMLFYTNETNTAAVNEVWDTTEQPPQIPAGTYYIAAGVYGENSVRVLRLALLDGRQLFLDAAGVSKVSVAANEQASITIDTQANIDAIIQVGGDLIP